MSVEAAVLLPVALTLVALLVQPVCVLYTRSMMASTAGELARLAATTRGDEEDLRDFALRRLEAVPEVSIFHTGGADAWDVEVDGPDEEGVVTVALAGRVRPLPLLGVLATALGEVEGDEVVLRVETSASVRASWIGGGYEDWIGIWG